MVPDSNLRLNPDNVTRLQAACNPLTDDGNHGIDHYLFVKDIKEILFQFAITTCCLKYMACTHIFV